MISGTITSAIAQLFLKAGTNAISVGEQGSGFFSLVLRAATQPFIVAGVSCYVLSMAIWLAVLSRLPVSVAYPLLSIGYIITAVFGFFLFGESLGVVKIVGIIIIIIGVIVLTSSVN